MRNLLPIARSNMRKAKGQTAAIVVLILIAALLLNMWLILSMDYKANFDRYHDKLNAEHVTVYADGDSEELNGFLQSTLSSDSNVDEYRIDDCMGMVATFQYNGGEINSWFVFMNKETALTRSIGKAEIVEEGNIASGVYLPMLYKTEENEIGKTIEISIGSHTETYTICGFFNNIMMGSHNCTMAQIILTQDKYDELDASAYAPRGKLCSVRLKDVEQNSSFQADIKSRISKRFPNGIVMSNCYAIVSQSRYISQGIVSAIMAVMAFLVLLIALVVIISNIINYIQVNMKNLGALKAIGYTSKQLVCSQILQFLFITLLAAVVGAAISYALFPAINSMMITQTGIPYAMRFLPLPLLITLLILCGAVTLSVWLASRRIKNIEPIAALRSGVKTHNFKKNRIPLEKTKAPLNLALALKTTLSGIKHNIVVFITMLVLSLVVVFSGLMTENMIADMTPFLNLIVGESADSCISVQNESEEEFLQVMNSDSRVEKAYLYSSFTVSHAGGDELVATVCDDFDKVNNKSVVYKGRFPKFENEIALAAKYAKEKGFEIGNEIEMTANGKTEKYLISGFTQIADHLGKDCLFTRSGYERLGEINDLSYYINLTASTDINAFNADMKEKFAGRLNTTINIDEIIQATSSVYVSLMTIIVIAILILSVVIIAFVLYLLVRTMLNNKKHDYGILKSLGFTTRQLILQTALSFMPAVILSTLIGLVVSCIVINPLMSLFLSSMGIMKCTFAVPILFTALSGVGLVLLSFGIACLLSLKIKKISPRTILAGE